MVVPRVVVAITFDRVHVATVVRGRVTECSDAHFDKNDLAEAIAGQLRSPVPRRRRIQLRPSVCVILAPSRCQLRLVSGPAQLSSRRLRALIQHNRRRFSLGNADDAQIRVELVRGNALLAVAERRLLEAIAAGVREGGGRLAHILPLEAVLSRNAADGSISFVDGPVQTMIELERGEIAAVERRFGEEPDPREGRASSASLLPDEMLGAAGFGFSRRLDFAPLVRPPVLQRIGYRAAAAVIAAMMIVDMAAVRLALESGDEVANPDSRAVASYLEQFDRDRALVIGTETFRDDAIRMNAILETLTAAMEPPTTVVSFALDGKEGRLTMLAPNAAGVLRELQELRLVTEVRPTSAISRETVAGLQLERLSLSFRVAARRGAAS